MEQALTFPLTTTPCLPFHAMVFSAPVVVPPIWFCIPVSISTPIFVFPMATAPVASVPMKFPCTKLPFAGVPPEISTPLPAFPEMTLPAPGAVPPTDVLDAEFAMSTPAATLPRAAVPAASTPIKFP